MENQSKSVEFHIGATVFSVIGALFILIALVILGLNYLDAFVMQLILYAVCIAVIFLSELLLRRINEHFSNVITAVALGGIFAVTLGSGAIRTLAFGILPLGIATAAGLFGVLFGRFRDSLLVRILTLLGFFTVFTVCGALTNELKLMAVLSLLLLFNLAAFLLENRTYGLAPTVLQLGLLFFYTIFLLISALKREIDLLYVIFLLVTILIACELPVLVGDKKGTPIRVIFGAIASGICLFGIVALFYWTTLSGKLDSAGISTLLYRGIALALIAAVVLAVYFLSDKEKGYRAIQLYFLVASAFLIANSATLVYERIAVLSVIYLIMRVLGRKRAHAIPDLIYAGIYGLSFVYTETISFGGGLRDDFAGAYLGKFGVGADAFVRAVLPQLLVLFVLLVGMLLFQHHYILNEILSMIFVSALLSAAVHDFVYLFTDAYDTAYGVYSLGVALVMLYFIALSRFKGRDQMPFTVVGLVLQGFAFFAFAISSMFSDGAMLSSIFFMLSAVLYIFCGFWRNHKGLRVVGLVLAGLTCLKLIGWDMRHLSPAYRIVAFLGVGILALVISLFYVKLEKRGKRETE